MTTHSYQAALRRVSKEMQRTAVEQEAALTPTEFDDILPIDHAFGPDKEQVAAYIDEMDKAEKPIDFAGLADYIYTRRTLAMNKAGMLYDAIDDAAMVPRRQDYFRFMQTSQVERHLHDLASAGADIRDIAPHLSPDFIKQHRAELEKMGLKRPSLVKSMASNVLHRNPYRGRS